jgi:transmembrane sensor
VVRKIQGTAPQIVVREGSVDLAPLNATYIHVDANTRVTVYSGGRILSETLTGPELDRELIWRDGKIAFEDTPLRDAIAAFDRYGAANIEVEDPAFLNRTVTGVFSSDDPMGFANAVAQVFDVKAVPKGRGLLLRDRE